MLLDWEHIEVLIVGSFSPCATKGFVLTDCFALPDFADEGELKPVPEDFASVDAYIAAFEPFVFAECRAELRQEWQEVCDGSKNHYEVIINGVETYETGEAFRSWSYTSRVRSCQGLLTIYCRSCCFRSSCVYRLSGRLHPDVAVIDCKDLRTGFVRNVEHCRHQITCNYRNIGRWQESLENLI